MKLMGRTSPEGKEFRYAFSLLELLAVISVMAIIMVLLLPGIASVYNGLQLSTAGQHIVDGITLARQEAVGKNRSVALRFYSVEPSNDFTACQSFVLQDDGTETPIGRLYRTPGNIVLSSNASHSNLLQQVFSGAVLQTGERAKFAEFHFKRDGSTDLDPSQSWYITVLNSKDESNNTPANYVGLLVEAGNGSIKVVRP